MNKFYTLLWCMALMCVPVKAEERPDNHVTTHAVMLGIGGSRQLDTYLSPMSYEGVQASFHRETLRMTHWADYRVSFQSLLHGRFSYTENPAGNANDWGGSIDYQAGWHYHWTPLPRLRLMAGGALGTQIGALYNTRNGNNPVQARFNLELVASVAATYSLHIRNYPIALRYQADLPVIGTLFSPHFGESYYEMSQNGIAHNFLLSHPGNALSLQQMFTVDLPIKRTCLRLGYLSSIRQSHVNHIKMHDINRSFLIGFVRHFRLLKTKDSRSSKAIL